MQDRAGKRISKIKQKPFRVGTFVSNFNVYTKCIKDSKTRNSDFTYDGLNMTCAGNKLVKTEDTGFSVTLSQSMDFKNNANLATEYLYDKNGDLIKDYNKSITEISYNALNLPQALKNSSVTNTYTYAADRRKLKTTYIIFT